MKKHTYGKNQLETGKTQRVGRAKTEGNAKQDIGQEESRGVDW